MLRILIVEDNLVFAKLLMHSLQTRNYFIVGVADSVETAIDLFDKEQPNLVLIDIELNGEQDGIHFANYINKMCRVPFIYLSDFFGESNKYFKRAIETRPANYLPKEAVQPLHIYHFIETALNNYSMAGGLFVNEEEANLFIRNQFFIKKNKTWARLNIEDVIYIGVNKPYCEILTETNKYLVRRPMTFIIEQFNNPSILRIHQSHAVNVNAIKEISTARNILTMNNGVNLDIGITYKEDVLAKLYFLT